MGGGNHMGGTIIWEGAIIWGSRGQSWGGGIIWGGGAHAANHVKCNQRSGAVLLTPLLMLYYCTALSALYLRLNVHALKDYTL